MPPARIVNLQHASTLKRSERICEESLKAIRRARVALDHARKTVCRSIDVCIGLESPRPPHS